MFTMVRSNLQKTQEFYHGTSVCAGSPKGVRIRCTPHTLEKFYLLFMDWNNNNNNNNKRATWVGCFSLGM
jgi:hypothetical protein